MNLSPMDPVEPSPANMPMTEILSLPHLYLKVKGIFPCVNLPSPASIKLRTTIRNIKKTLIAQKFNFSQTLNKFANSAALILFLLCPLHYI